MNARNLQAKLLLSAVKSLNVSSCALESYLRNHCLHILRFSGFKVPISRKKIVCQFCHIPWEYGTFNVKILPSIRKGKKIKKIIRRMESHRRLSKIHKKLMSSLQTANTVVLKCWICHKVTVFKTTKNMYIENIVPVENQGSTIKSKKKKKKNKNLYSGLNAKVLNQFHAFKNNKRKVQIKTKFNDKELCNSVDANKRKMDSESILGISACSTEKIARLEGTEDNQGKYLQHSLNVSNTNCQPSTKLCNDNIIPMEENVTQKCKSLRKQKKDIKTLNSNPNRKNKFNMNKKAKVINPFCDKVQILLAKKNKKKLNKLKDLINNEEKKNVLGTSLKDFLTIVKD